MNLKFNTNRPIAPHISIYNPQLYSIFSIFHRITGIIIFLVLIFNLIFIILFFNIYYFIFLVFSNNILFYINLFFINYFFTTIIIYHFFNGLRLIFGAFFIY